MPAVPWWGHGRGCGLNPGGGRAVAVSGTAVSFLAGLFNLRGDDIPYNPVFYSYTLLTNTTIRWASHRCGHGAWRGLTTHPPFHPSIPEPAPTGPSSQPCCPLSPEPPHPAMLSPIDCPSEPHIFPNPSPHSQPTPGHGILPFLTG